MQACACIADTHECLHIHLYVFMHTCAQFVISLTEEHVHNWYVFRVCVCVCVCMYVCMCVCLSSHIYSVYVCIHVAYIYMHVYMYLYMWRIIALLSFHCVQEGMYAFRKHEWIDSLHGFFFDISNSLPFKT
jgi:hypothetical protein